MPRTLPAQLTTAMDSGVFKAYLAIGQRNHPGYTTLITNILYYKYDGLELNVKWASPNLPETDGLTLGNKYYLDRGVTISGVNYTIKSASLRFDDYTYARQIVTASFSLFSGSEKPATTAGDVSYSSVLTTLNPNPGTVSFKVTPENSLHWGYNFYATGKQVILKSYQALLPILQQKYLIKATDNSDDTHDDEIQYFHLASPINARYWYEETGAQNKMKKIIWSPEKSMFLAVGNNGAAFPRCETSTDGRNWTDRSGTMPAKSWQSVAWSPSLGLFAAVAFDVATTNVVATSPDGITWTNRTSSAKSWRAITWSAELNLFVAVGNDGNPNACMTSANGVTWTDRTMTNQPWTYVCWSPQLMLFVAGSNTNVISTSSDGITWTDHAITAGDAINKEIAWSPSLGLFVGMGISGASSGFWKSTNGTTWSFTSPYGVYAHDHIVWSPELAEFVATSETGGLTQPIVKSINGTGWTAETITVNKQWGSVAWGNSIATYTTFTIDGTVTILTSIEAVYPDHTITQGDITLHTNNLLRKFIWRDEAETIHTSGAATDVVHNLGYLESTASPPASFANSDRANAIVGIHLKYKTGDIFKLQINSNQTATYIAKVTEILDPDAEIGWRCEIELMERFSNTDGGPIASTIERTAAYTPLVTTNFNGNLDATVNNLQAFADKVDDLTIPADVAGTTHAATSKATPVDTDEIPLVDSAASWILKKLTWANLKATLKTYLDTLYATIAKGVTNGDSHDHNGGDGAQIAHTALSSIGTNTHAQIDTQFATTLPATYAPIAKGVTNGDTHDHNGGDGAQIDFLSLSNRPVAETNANDIYRVANSPGATKWTGTFTAAGSSGTTIKYATTGGNAGVLTPNSTGQLGKLRVYNTTRGNNILVANHVAGTITSVSNFPGNWANGDVLTTVSQTTIGGGVDWMDIEITSGILNKSYIFMNWMMSTNAANNGMFTHPFTASYATSAVKEHYGQVANVNIAGFNLQKINSNVFSLAWTGLPTSVILSEAGYLE